MWDLRERAAALGHPTALGLAAVAATYGLRRPTADPTADFAIVPQTPQAAIATGVLQYSVAAHAGDTLAQVVLGNRFRRGLHVPQSCELALLTLLPAAEEAADAAASLRGLPMVRLPLESLASMLLLVVLRADLMRQPPPPRRCEACPWCPSCLRPLLSVSPPVCVPSCLCPLLLEPMLL